MTLLKEILKLMKAKIFLSSDSLSAEVIRCYFRNSNGREWR